MKPQAQLSLFDLSDDLKRVLKTILENEELEKIKLAKELRDMKHVNSNLKIEIEELRKSDLSRSDVTTSGAETTVVETPGVETSGVETSGIETSGIETDLESDHSKPKKRIISGRQTGRPFISRKLRKKTRSRPKELKRVKSEKLLIIGTLNRDNEDAYPDPEGPNFIYPDRDHPNRSQTGNDFIFISRKSEDTVSFEPGKLLRIFMNMIVIDETDFNEIIGYIDESENPREALCSKLKENSSITQGRGYIEPYMSLINNIITFVTSNRTSYYYGERLTGRFKSDTLYRFDNFSIYAKKNNTIFIIELTYDVENSSYHK